YSGTQAAFIVFDLTNRQSYANVINWYKELKEFTTDEEIPIVLVGNKSDLKNARQVFYQEGVKLANEISENEVIKLSYIETSALTGENIEDAFNLISYHYVMRSKEIEDERRSELLYDRINSILKKKIVLTLSFVTETSIWSPGIQIIAKIKQLGDRSMVRDYEDEQVYQYLNGLIIKQHLYSAVDDISSSDGVFCIFDARNEQQLYQDWQNIIIKLIENVKENGVILIGIQASETSSWSKIIEEVNVDNQLKNKEVDLFFCRINDDFLIEIFDQLKSMLEVIDDKY
ncbi:MAG: hypothetical protein ACFE8N_10715, partial [Promethearchaeota archaeon]